MGDAAAATAEELGLVLPNMEKKYRQQEYSMTTSACRLFAESGPATDNMPTRENSPPKLAQRPRLVKPTK